MLYGQVEGILLFEWLSYHVWTVKCIQLMYKITLFYSDFAEMLLYLHGDELTKVDDLLVIFRALLGKLPYALYQRVN